MKNLKLVCLFFILLAGCAAPEKPTYSTEIGNFTPYGYFPDILNGKVKKVIEKSYITKMDGDTVVVDRPLTQADRDSIGWTNDFTATFTEDGNLVQCDELDENNKVLYSNRTVIENGQVVKATFFKGDSLSGYQKIDYDSLGRVDMAEYFNSQDTLKTIVNIETNDNGDITTALFYDSQMALKSKFEASYNENNRRAGYKFFNPEGVKTFEQKFQYNDHGFMEKQVLINKEGVETTALYTFDYDQKGNWITSTSDDGKSRVISKRTIEYFE